MRTQTPQKRELFACALRTIVLGVFAVFVFAVVIVLRTPGVADAATSSTINFQARLQNSSGGIVPDGNYNVEFKLYDASTGGTALWTETRQNNAGNGVTVRNGYLSVSLGSVTAFPGTINWDQDLWLTMNIGGTTTGVPGYDGEMNPRLKLTSTPYAFQAKSASQLQQLQSSHTGTLLFNTLTTDRNVYLPDENGTICLQGSVNCGFLDTTTANSSFIQLQGSSPGTAQTGNFNITGTGIATTLQGTNVKANSFGGTSGNGSFLRFNLISTILSSDSDINVESTTNGAITIGGTTTASVNVNSAVNLNQNVTVASGKTVTVQGSALFKNGTDSTAAFQVQSQSTATPILNVDTSNARVGFGTATPQAPVHLSLDGVTPASSLLFSPQGMLISGSGSQTNLQLVHVSSVANSKSALAAVRARGTPNAPTKVLQGDNIFSFQASGYDGSARQNTGSIDFSVDGATSAGSVPMAIGFAVGSSTANRTTVTTISSAGAATFQNRTDSTAGFVIQNSAATSNLFVADTTNTRIGIGKSSPGYMLDVNGDINTAGVFRVGGTSGSTTTCTGGNVLTNAVIQGGIVTGGTCAANGGGTAPTLQDVYNNSTSPATILLNSTNLGVTIKDASTTVGGNLFAIQNNAGTTSYLAVTTSGASVAGTFNVAGSIQTSGTTRLDASGNLTNIGSINASGNLVAAGTAFDIGASGSARLNNVNSGFGNKVTLTNGEESIVLDQKWSEVDIYGNMYQYGPTHMQDFSTPNNSTILTVTQNKASATVPVAVFRGGATPGAGADLLQLQNSASSVLFSVSNYGLVNTTAGYAYNGTAGATTTCTGGNVLTNAVIQGGIVTGGTCVANGGGTTGVTLQATTPGTADVGNFNITGTGIAGVLQSGSLNVYSTSTTNPTVVLRAAVSQTSNFLEFQNNDGSGTYAYIDSAGIYHSQGVILNGNATNAALAVSPSSASQIGLSVKGKTNQTADLLRIQDSGSAVVFNVDNYGNAYVGPNSGPSNQSGNGTAGGNSGYTLKVIGQTGGNTTGTTGQVAGAGGGILLQGGTGGGAGTGSTNGSGGSITLSAGAAGSSTGAAGAAGSVIVKNQTNSITAFQIQNASGTNALTVDTTNLQVIAGTTTNGVILSANGIVLNGTARNAKTIRLAAEYAGAVLDAGTGSSNSGTMTSGLDLTNRMNYYKWTTTQATNQSYDVVVQVPIPTDFSAWASNPLTISGYTSNTTNGTITLEARDTTGTVQCNFVSVTPGSTSTWASNNTACTLSAGTYTAGDYMTLRIRLQSPTSGDVRVGNITLNYLSKF